MAGSSADGGTGAQIGQATPSGAFLTSLHPSGDPRTVLVIDQPPDRTARRRQGDVVVLVMALAQCRDAEIREAMIKCGVSALAADGILWVDVPGQWRWALMKILRANGMVIGVPTVCRHHGAAQIEFALTRSGLRFGMSGGHVSSRWWLALAVLERVPWGKAMLLRLLPGVGFPAFVPGVKPFKWLIDGVAATEHVDVAVKTSWRGAQAPFLVFAIGKSSTVIAKRGGPDFHAQIAREAAMLNLLGPGLAKARLEVPRVVDYHSSRRLCSLVETAVPGRPMASWIREGCHRDLGTISNQLAGWLCRWNGQTVRHVELTRSLGELLILSTARELTGAIQGGAAYLEWLLSEIARLAGKMVPLVAAHNDLTMANVLGDSSGIRSVVDWEAASPDGLPLADFRYACCDAATAINGGDRLTAFRACFLEVGEPLQVLQHSEAQLSAVIGGPPEWLELCVHATWLRHAANEQARSSQRRDSTFLAIADALASSVLFR